MVVPQLQPHRIPRGDKPVENVYSEKPAQVLKLGNATIRIFAPILTEQEQETRNVQVHSAIADILRTSQGA